LDFNLLNEKQQAAIELLGNYLKKQAPQEVLTPSRKLKPSEWINRNYYIPETRRPIELMPHQTSIIDYALDEANNFTTIVYSTVKKSGKTAIAGAIGRYLAENSGYRAEILTVANDESQARSRGYQSLLTSIELTPGFNRLRNLLPGQWKIIEKQAVHLPTNSIVRAIANDAEGEAGGNPVATIWTEIWGLKTEKDKKLWAELTPVPTRERSLRIIETYAGYEDESKILLEVYKRGLEGRRLTHDDIDWPFPDQPPIWVNNKSRLFMYWDTGEVARRMPWQTPDYYAEQAESLTEDEFKRFHFNEWVTSTSPFIRIEWWRACQENLLPVTPTEPCILGVDASVSGDCTAIALVTRHPDPTRRFSDVALRRYQVWVPPKNGTINLQEVEDEIREWCKRYNIVQITYDQFQLHHMMGRLTQDAVAWCNVFGQQSPRAIADKALYDLILNRRIAHDGDPGYEVFIQNAAAKGDLETTEKLRIVKKAEGTPVDPVVATSMAAFECLRLNI
jgi:phage terminase large subunit-like protein